MVGTVEQTRPNAGPRDRPLVEPQREPRRDLASLGNRLPDEPSDGRGGGAESSEEAPGGGLRPAAIHQRHVPAAGYGDGTAAAREARYRGAQALSPAALQLSGVWQEYLERGDGRFNRGGLTAQLRSAGLTAEVVADPALGEHVLGVDLESNGTVYLLPAFASTPAAVAAWFDALGGAASRLNRVRQVREVAVVRRKSSGGWEVLKKGVVE